MIYPQHPEEQDELKDNSPVSLLNYIDKESIIFLDESEIIKKDIEELIYYTTELEKNNKNTANNSKLVRFNRFINYSELETYFDNFISITHNSLKTDIESKGNKVEAELEAIAYQSGEFFLGCYINGQLTRIHGPRIAPKIKEPKPIKLWDEKTATKPEAGKEPKNVKVKIDGNGMVKAEFKLREYKVKNPALKPLVAEIKKLLSKYDKKSIKYISREQNAGADKLANEAIDGFQAGKKEEKKLEGIAEQEKLF